MVASTRSREPRWARWAIALLIVAAPLVVVPTARDSFGLPKLLASEWMTLASVLALLLWWRSGASGSPDGPGERVDLVAFARQPVVRAVGPLFLVATASWAWSSHRAMTREALVAFWVGAVGLVVWSLAAEALRLRRLLDLLLVPALLLAVLGILQSHGLFQPFGLSSELAGRQEATSLAGNVGVFGAYFLLPFLLVLERLVHSTGSRHRGRFAAHLALGAIFLYAMVVSQTLTAFAALAASLVTYLILRVHGRVRAISLAAIVAGGLALVLVGPQVSQRLAASRQFLLDGQWNTLLSYRGDAWAAASRILRQHPLGGTGHGTFKREFAEARLQGIEAGHPVSPGNFYPHFANAHNDYLEVGAELGLLGIVALAFGVWFVAAAALAHGAERALASAGTVAIGVLALAYFPFETPLLAYPSLLFLAWVLSRRPTQAER